MSLLYEYTFTPDVFDESCYPHEEVASVCIEQLRRISLEESIVRNLRAGEWIEFFKRTNRPWHRYGKEILKKIKKQSRLRDVDPVLPEGPESDEDWCSEALASHESNPLDGIIVTDNILKNFDDNPVFMPINKVNQKKYRDIRPGSARLSRTYEEYKKQLEIIFRCSNSIMLIDPHLDPSERRYSELINLLLLAKEKEPKPVIEVHRAIYKGSGPSREIKKVEEWEKIFKEYWYEVLKKNKLKVRVCIWKSMHDRYLISNLIGISLGNGFDTTNYDKDMTTWSRLDIKTKENIERDFDPSNIAINQNDLAGSFTIL